MSFNIITDATEAFDKINIHSEFKKKNLSTLERNACNHVNPQQKYLTMKSLEFSLYDWQHGKYTHFDHV